MGLLGGKKSKQIVGLDIGSSSIKAVELKATKAGYELVSFGMETLAPDTVVDGAIMDAPQVANAISKIFEAQRIKTKNVATSVSGHSVIVKRVPLPLMTEEELYDRIPSEASQHIPFDIADVNLSYQLLESMDSQMDVLLVAVKKDKILNHTNVLAQAGKTPVVVDIDAFGLQNCFEINYEPDAGQTVALLNIGASVNVQQRHRLPRIRFVVDFEAVLQSEGIDIHHHRRLSCLRQNVGVVQNLVFLHRHQQNIHLRVHRLQQLIAQVHVRDIKWNVLAGFGRNPIVKFFLGHQRQRNALHDYRVPRNGCRHVLGLDPLGLENLANGVRHLRRIHDRSVYH